MGQLLAEGEWFHAAFSTGMIRLKYKKGTITSNFKKVGDDCWGEDVIAQAGSSQNVKHVQDSMVIFDSSYVMPLFVASASEWSRTFSDSDYGMILTAIKVAWASAMILANSHCMTE